MTQVTLNDCINITEQICKADKLLTLEEFVDMAPIDPYEEAQQRWEQQQEERFAMWLHFPGDRPNAPFEPEPFYHY